MAKKKDAFAPKRRAPHAYMHNRPMDAPDTVSLNYPHLDQHEGSSLYYASLTSSVHRINGTKKRDNIMESIQSVYSAYGESIA